jgi:glutamate 5-kinase
MRPERQNRVIVVKVGSQVLCADDGRLGQDVIAQLARQVATLCTEGWKVLVVSSGAVAAGSGANLNLERLPDPVMRKQVLAATGQVLLMSAWREELATHDLEVAQVLTSKSDFQTRGHYLNMRGCLEGLIRAGIVPIVNENDVVAVTELMFTDNDELASLLAGMVDADLLVMLSSVPGLCFGGDTDEQVIPQWDASKHRAEDIVREGTSRLGRGGMHSKLAIALSTASLGTEVVIADGRAPDVLIRVAQGEAMGTCFPALNPVSPAKRWLASAEGHATASVIINQGAAEALTDDSRLTSLLPVGIVSLDGDFDRGDVLLIRDEDGHVLGCGRAQYDREEADAAVGKRGQRPLIHYDFLYLASRGSTSDG